MTTFAINRIEIIAGKQRIYKLVINGICLFDEFEKEILEINKQYRAELGSIYRYLEVVAHLKSLPKTKFKDITPNKQLIREYEVKTKNIRVYILKIPDGKLIVIAGHKNIQKRDLRRFRSIKQQLIEAQII